MNHMVGVILTFIGLLIVVSLIMAIPVYFLWNTSLVGAISSVNEITFYQSWGITLLIALLFRTNFKP